MIATRTTPACVLPVLLTFDLQVAVTRRWICRPSAASPGR
jgi:hypothetical protein